MADLAVARKVLRKQSKPAFVYKADDGCGNGELGYFVAYVSAIDHVAKDTSGEYEIVEFNELAKDMMRELNK